MNQQYIQQLSDQDLKKEIIRFLSTAKELPDETLNKLIPLLKTRVKILKDFEKLTGFFSTAPDIKSRNEKEKTVIKELIKSLKELNTWNKDTILLVLKSILTSQEIKMPVLYYICTGEEKGLPLPESLEIIGKEEILSRLEKLQSSI